MGGDPRPQSPLMCSSSIPNPRRGDSGMTGVVTGGGPLRSPPPPCCRRRSRRGPGLTHQAREQSLLVGECDRVVDITLFLSLLPPPSPHSLHTTAALKTVSQHMCDRRIVCALAFYQGWWGVRPKSPVMSQPPRLVDLLYREDPHILCFREACQRPSLPSLFGMPYGHSLSC